MCALTVLSALTSLPDLARADDVTARGEDDAGLLVAVLPFAAADRRMTMYGKPIADAVARALTPQVKSARVEVQAISLSAAVPRRVRLVIDGRIVASGKGKLALEAQVRDPERGVRLASVSGSPGALTDVDELAQTLGRELTERVLRAAAQVRARRERAGGARTGSPGAGSSSTGAKRDAPSARDAPTATGDATRPSQATGPDLAERPALIVFTPSGQGAGGSIEVVDIATEAAFALAVELGYRPVASKLSGMVETSQAIAAMAEHKVTRALMLDIRDVEFTWRGVLTARGRFRARLIDDAGKTLAKVARRTDTLVGSRGDRHRAIVYFVIDQIVDILRAELAVHAYRPETARGAHRAHK